MAKFCSKDQSQKALGLWCIVIDAAQPMLYSFFNFPYEINATTPIAALFT